MTVIWNGSRQHSGGPYLGCDHYDPNPVLGTLPDNFVMPSQLNPKQQAMLIKECAAGEYTKQETAERWNIDVRTLQSFLHRAKVKHGSSSAGYDGICGQEVGRHPRANRTTLSGESNQVLVGPRLAAKSAGVQPAVHRALSGAESQPAEAFQMVAGQLGLF